MKTNIKLKEVLRMVGISVQEEGCIDPRFDNSLSFEMGSDKG
ncbi:MAG: hypothetical protein PWQ92_142 [Thermococcaceae archaeon]|nr:hypothetical protein [Thermococcaceae archaeon]